MSVVIKSYQTLTAHRRELVHYKCCKCGAENLYLYDVESDSHSLSSQAGAWETKSAAAEAAEEVAVEEANLLRAVNVDHNYEMVRKKVICPRCGEKQVWSGIPCTWRKVSGFGFWIVGLVLCSFESFVLLAGALTGGPELLGPSIVFSCLLLLLISLPFIRKSKRKKALEKIANTNFEPPTFISGSNLSKLEEETPDKGTETTCDGCGKPFAEGLGVCPFCGKIKS